MRRPPEPLAPVPDVKDWSWATDRSCSTCGFEPATVEPADLPELILGASERYEIALERKGAEVRPAPQTWSAIEYGQHVADVLELMTQRLEQILESDGGPVAFNDWDQDAAALEKEYWLANAHATSVLVKERAEGAAKSWEEPEGEQWDWKGTRSDGREFTVAALGRYLAHELIHHLHDVDG